MTIFRSVWIINEENRFETKGGIGITLEEMQARCKKAKVTTNDEVMAVSPIYCLLNFDKDDFCKLVDAIGLEKWVEAKARWEWLCEAEGMYEAKRRYEKNKARYMDLQAEQEQLLPLIEQYEAANSI
jgi:hypothetical protein